MFKIHTEKLKQQYLTIELEKLRRASTPSIDSDKLGIVYRLAESQLLWLKQWSETPSHRRINIQTIKNEYQRHYLRQEQLLSQLGLSALLPTLYEEPSYVSHSFMTWLLNDSELNPWDQIPRLRRDSAISANYTASSQTPSIHPVTASSNFTFFNNATPRLPSPLTTPFNPPFKVPEILDIHYQRQLQTNLSLLIFNENQWFFEIFLHSDCSWDEWSILKDLTRNQIDLLNVYRLKQNFDLPSERLYHELYTKQRKIFEKIDKENLTVFLPELRPIIQGNPQPVKVERSRLRSTFELEDPNEIINSKRPKSQPEKKRNEARQTPPHELIQDPLSALHTSSTSSMTSLTTESAASFSTPINTSASSHVKIDQKSSSFGDETIPPYTQLKPAFFDSLCNFFRKPGPQAQPNPSQQPDLQNAPYLEERITVNAEGKSDTITMP